MEVKSFDFIQEAFKGFLNCLGLEGMNNSPPPQSPLAPEDSTTYETLPAADNKSFTDPLLHISTSSDQSGNIPVPTTRGIDDNVGDENNSTLVTIDEIMNMSGGKIAEAHYVDLVDDGKTNMTLLATRLISSGGGGKTH